MLRWFLAVAAAAVSMQAATAAFVVNTVFATGPVNEGAGGASLNAFATNAVAGLRSGGDAGSVGQPNYWVAAGPSVSGGLINSIAGVPGVGTDGVLGLWNGVVNNPGFNGHLGNGIYAGLSAVATGGDTFQVQHVSFSGYTYAFGNTPGFNLSAAVPGGNVFGATTAGGPLSVVTAADIGTTNYVEIYYGGERYSIPNTYNIDFTTPASLQALFLDPITPRGLIQGTWTVDNGLISGSGLGGTEINAVPAPASLIIMGFGFAGARLISRRRRSA
jgi:hypothetical protein